MERERDEEFGQEMYLETDHTFRDNNGSGVVTRRRTGSKINVNPQVLSEKGNACKRQETL